MSFYTPSVAVDPMTAQHTSQALVLANGYVLSLSYPSALDADGGMLIA